MNILVVLNWMVQICSTGPSKGTAIQWTSVNCAKLSITVRSEICHQTNIPNINTHKISKSDIQKAIYKSHYEDMISCFERSRRLQDIKNSDFSKVQPYFNDRSLENARTKFKIRTKMLEKVPGHF